jgi:uncharacterized metal-binding protein
LFRGRADSIQTCIIDEQAGIAEMSFLKGMVSERKSFMQKMDHKIMVIDGCQLECAKLIFEKQKLSIDSHIVYTSLLFESMKQY